MTTETDYMGVTDNVTSEPLHDLSSLDCDRVRVDYEVLPAVGFAVCFVIGVYYCFFGYRCLRPSLFLAGLLSASAVIAAVCIRERLLPPLGKAGVALLAGLIVAVLSVIVQRVGVAILGASLGASSAVAVLVALRLAGVIATRWPAAGALLGGGVVGAAVAVRWPRRTVVVATAVVGAAMVVGALDYAVDALALASLARDVAAGTPRGALCWYAWLLLALWPATAAVGVVAQFLLTARGRHYHSDDKQTKTLHLQRMRSNGSKEAANSRYRHIYQARRANGDVITQNYLLGGRSAAGPVTTRIPLHPGLKVGEHAERGKEGGEAGSTNTTLTQVATS